MEQKQVKNSRIGVILGGLSSEREVSLNTGKAILEALRERGYDVVSIDADRDLPQRLNAERIEVAVLALHGRYGEDGCVQGLLEMMGIPYTGSGVLPSALAMDKPLSKKLFAASDILTPDFIVLEQGSSFRPDLDTAGLGPRVVVKPAAEGSSVGIGICKSNQDLREALRIASAYPGDLMIERFIEGRELTVGVLNGDPMAILEIKPTETFYDYRAKYESHETRYLVPAPVTADIEDRALDVARRSYELMGCSGVIRADFILSEDQQLYLLEINTLPGMTDTSLIPKMAEHRSMSFSELCEQILLGADLKR